MHLSFRAALATTMILGGLLAPLPLSVVAAATNEIRVVLRYADGAPVGGDRAKGISIFSSKQDANGNPIRDRQVAYGSTGDTGSVRFKDLPDGTYFIESDLGWGYQWHQIGRPIRLSGGAALSFELRLARFTMSLRYGDGSISAARGVTIFTTKRDANGAEIAADGVAYASSGDTGRVAFDLTPGRYTFGFDAAGYPWAELPRPFSAVSGQAFDVQANLGRLRIVLRGTDGSPLNIGVHIFTQQPDANANPATAAQVGYAATGATGQTYFDLTPGMYWVSYSTPSGQDVAVPNVPVVSGQVTLYDGSSVQAPPASSPPTAPPVTTPPAPVPTPPANQATSQRRVLVLLQGINSSLADAPDTFGDVRTRMSPHYDDLVDFSYSGGLMRQSTDGTWGWAPQNYDAVDTHQPLETSAQRVAGLITLYRLKYPGAQFDLIGHSLGGAVAWAFVVRDVQSVGRTDSAVHAVMTLDSPVNGVAHEALVNFLWLFSVNCARLHLSPTCSDIGNTVVQELAAKGDIQQSVEEFNQQTANVLVDSGAMHVLTVASLDDCVVRQGTDYPDRSAAIPGHELVLALGRGDHGVPDCDVGSWLSEENRSSAEQSIDTGHAEVLHNPEVLDALELIAGE